MQCFSVVLNVIVMCKSGACCVYVRVGDGMRGLVAANPKKKTKIAMAAESGSKP